MSAARTERLLNLVTLLLNTRRPLSLRELRDLDAFRAYCTEDPVSGERTFERDKATLVELGVPLRWIAPEEDGDEKEGTGGYVIDRASYYLADPGLTPSELALLSIAGAAAVAIEGFPGRAAVVRALAKIGFDIDPASPAPTFAHAPVERGVDAAKVGKILRVLQDALAARHHVILSYQNAWGGGREVTERLVRPYGLFHRSRAWYLVAFCCLRQAVRTFHLARIGSASVGPRQRGPSYDIPAGFSLQEHARRRSWEFPREEPVEVTVRLAARLVPAIAEIFGARARVEPLAEGGVLVHVVATHPDALIDSMLPYGDGVEILTPEALRRRIAAIYEALASRYQAGLGACPGGGER